MHSGVLWKSNKECEWLIKISYKFVACTECFKGTYKRYSVVL